MLRAWGSSSAHLWAIHCEGVLIDSPVFEHTLGALAALGAAACWALSSILFRWAGDAVSAGGLNLVKGLVALVGLTAVLALTGWQSANLLSLSVLAASGLIGIAVGDTLYFKALVVLGPRNTLTLTLLVPVATAIGAFALWNETISLVSAVGVMLVLVGVAVVLRERAPKARQQGVVTTAGVGFALLYVAAEAVGILMTKFGVAEMSAAQATLIRQAAAVMALAAWAGLSGRLVTWVAPLREVRLARLVIGASFVGGFVGMWLAVYALKYTYAGVAATLTAASPLFILPLGAWLMKERVSVRSALGVGVAMIGIAVYFLQIN